MVYFSTIHIFVYRVYSYFGGVIWSMSMKKFDFNKLQQLLNSLQKERNNKLALIDQENRQKLRSLLPKKSVYLTIKNGNKKIKGKVKWQIEAIVFSCFGNATVLLRKNYSQRR